MTTTFPVVRAYDSADEEAWEDVIARSSNGTMLHARRFISYHGDRFQDRSLVLEDSHGRVAGVFPAAADPAEPGTITSHPGLTYGGLVHDGSIRGESLIGSLEAIAREYRGHGFLRLRYKAVPAIYERCPAGDDIYALFRLGAGWRRCDLSATIDLHHRGRVSTRRLRSLRRAALAGVSVAEDWCRIGPFWQILELNLARRHRTAPAHTLDEIDLLHTRFPRDIRLITASIGDEMVAGGVFFLAGPVLHMQYSAATDRGRDISATDSVMDTAIARAGELGCRFFDFGISTVDDGQILNSELYHFKASFGAGGTTCNHYVLDL